MSNQYAAKPPVANNLIIFDFETGGVDPIKNPVTEIALTIISGEDFKLIGSYESLIAPYNSELIYDPKAAQVSGITYDMCVEEGKDIKVVAQQVLDMFKLGNTAQSRSAGGYPMLVGHNVQFDIAFLQHLFNYGFAHEKSDQWQIHLEKSLHGRRDFHNNFQPTYQDTWAIAKAWLQNEEMINFKLGTITEKLGIDLNNAHRAMNDVVSTRDVFVTYANSLRSSFQQTHKGLRDGFYFPI